MNSKKNKGKSKPNKPQNPNPPQKLEEPSKDTEKVEDVSVGDFDSASKSDIRVPEIISEVITPVVDVKEKEEDSPKKPKRNRGKKKKNDKDEDENLEEKTVDSVDVVEIVTVETQEILIEESVAPSSRKKKNKNKKSVEPDTKGTEKIELENPVTPVTEQKETELSVKDESKPQDVTDQEVKPSKKKNKKKKRNDSERSEKAEELSCITAFQSLLKDDKIEVKVAENQPVEEVKTHAETFLDSPRSVEKDFIKDSKFTKPEAEVIEKQKDVTQDLPKTATNEPGGKNKKKNKKDKKEPPKETEIKDLSESDFEMPEIVPITSTTLTSTELTENVKDPKPVKEKKSTETLDLESKDVVEDIKSKAKIAKPVEKKRKGKEDENKKVQELPEMISVQEKEIPVPKLLEEEMKPLNISKVEEVKSVAAESLSAFTKTKENKQKLSGETTAKAVETGTDNRSIEFFDVPERDKNKNRTKSPKPGKQDQMLKSLSHAELKPEIYVEKEIQPTTSTPVTIFSQPIKVKSQDAIITEAFEELIRIPESDKSKKRKKSPKPNKPDQKSKTLTETIEESIIEPTTVSHEETKTILDSKIKEEISTRLTAEVIEHQKEIVCEEPKSPISDETKKEHLSEKEDSKTDDANTLEIKSKKKGKKSPKLPFGPETTTGTSEKLTKQQEFNPKDDTNIQKSEDEFKGKTDIFYNMPLAEDIEIQSLKADESEGSPCGFTPDIIQYPRATSQDLIDDNNNMLIQEITVEEVKLQIPTDIPDTPFIQGSGETPLSTPECVFIGVQISEMTVDAGKGEQEKTDIKTKMMEVNQDMEELRRSIERSLAELTSIEKSEGEIEKKFEEKTPHTSNVPKSPEVKISMPSELIFKSQSEKLETPTSKEIKPEGSMVSSTVDVKPAEISTPIPLPYEKLSRSKDVKAKPSEKILPDKSSAADLGKSAQKNTETIAPPIVPARKDKSVSKERDLKNITIKPTEEMVKPSEIDKDMSTQPETVTDASVPPVIPARKDNKNKGKNKKKGKHDVAQTSAQTESSSTSTETKEPTQDKKQEQTEQKPDTKQDKGKKHSTIQPDDSESASFRDGDHKSLPEFEPIENFEDAMTSSADDINKSFEMIANEAQTQFIGASHVNPEINIVAPIEDTTPDKKDEKVNPVSPPKNLLGHPDIPVQSNRTDYKKEKNKAPNTIMAKVKIKDAVHIENKKETKDTQTDNIQRFLKAKSIDESFSSMTNENDEFVYKYSFRKVFLQSACHVCKKELKQTRVPCSFCNLIFYCNAKHKDEDWAKHQGFCFAVSTIVHLKDQKHIYADSKNITGQDYRLLRMQMIVSCEKVLKRKLTPFEQEALLYPRVCASASCREWRQSKLIDCDGCGQISYCSDHPEHFPKTHQRWCKSYSLYQKLVCYQQTCGRLEPKMPSKIMEEPHQVSEKMNEVLAAMYEEKIDMNDIQYAALTQIATAPLTAAYCLQAYSKMTNHTNGTYKKTSCTIHIVGGELQFEADALNKWEVFFLHLRPDLQELRVVMIGRDLNPSNLPLELLGKVKLCENCRASKRRVVFGFQDNTTYHDYWAGDEFVAPDIVCAFNPSIKRSSMYNGKDPWPRTINCVLKLKTPFAVTAYTMNELQKDLARIKECSEVDPNIIIEPKFNSFASVRPDRNFISDDEMPLLFKNYCYSLIIGAN